MANGRDRRRLAAILSADVVGYSRLMGADESGTLAQLKALRKELIDPKIAEYDGRIFKTTGDGILIEFSSVIDAVQMAVEVQHDMGRRNEAVPEDHRIVYRVGINQGDIIVDGDDIHGDGVNVAARLEAMAEPGGICISHKVRDEIRDKLPYALEDLGEVEVKNIARPVRAFRVKLDEAGSAPALAPAAKPAAGKASPTKSRRAWLVPAIAAAVVLIAAVGGGALWWQPWVTRVEAANVSDMAFPLPDKPSIVVLPFVNLSGDPDQEFLVDGLSEDITTALARLPSIFVMSRNSAMTYKGRPVKVQQVAEDLGVQYVLEGSVQRDGDRLRVNAQLIDALSGRHVWAEKFDRDMTDLFAVRDEMTLQIASNINAEIGFGNRLGQRGTDNLEAWLFVREGLPEYLKFTPEGNLRSRELFLRAIELDPNYSVAIARMAHSFRQVAQYGFDDDPAGALAKGFEFAEQALSVNDSEALVYAALAALNVASRKIDAALEAATKAAEMMPDFVNRGMLGWILNFSGRPAEGRDHLKLSIRLNPNPPEWVNLTLGDSYLLLEDYGEAERMYERVGGTSRFFEFWHFERLALVYAATGREDEARESIASAIEAFPPGSIKLIRDFDPYEDQSIVDGWVETLRRLGLPE